MIRRILNGGLKLNIPVTSSIILGEAIEMTKETRKIIVQLTMTSLMINSEVMEKSRWPVMEMVM